MTWVPTMPVAPVMAKRKEDISKISYVTEMAGSPKFGLLELAVNWVIRPVR